MTDVAISDATLADEIVQRLTRGEKAWAATSLAERAQLLVQATQLTDRHAAEWVEVARTIKGLDAGSPLVGEEWISGPWTLIYGARALTQTVARLAAGTDPLEGFTFRAAPGGRVAVQVMPHTVWDKLLLSGFSAEVWLEPGSSEQEARDTAGLGLLDPSSTEGVCLVLGAGNIMSIAPLDAIYQLYAENRAVVLKLNPITNPLQPVLEKVLAPFIELGVLEIVTGSIELGTALAHHPGVAAVHLTGSEQTHDAIVWGSGEAGTAAKAAGEPLLAKPMTSELGGVGPVIVVPGTWSKSDLRFQAEHVATQRLHNGGSNCVAAQVLIISSDWDQRDEFLTELRRAFAKAAPRPAWYPGSENRVAAARDTHPGCVVEPGGTPERTIIERLDLDNPDETAFRDEYFGPVLGIAELPGTGVGFLRHAVDAANDTLRGTLGANIIVHPRDIKAMGSQFEDLIAALRYGTIAVNAWTGVGYLYPFCRWGAFPGHALEDVQSGRGVVHNAGLLAYPERTVVTGPFRPLSRSLVHGEMSISPKPPWFVTNRTAAKTGELLTHFSAAPSWGGLPKIFASALRG